MLVIIAQQTFAIHHRLFVFFGRNTQGNKSQGRYFQFIHNLFASTTMTSSSAWILAVTWFSLCYTNASWVYKLSCKAMDKCTMALDKLLCNDGVARIVPFAAFMTAVLSLTP
jgi:hypothetical protein